MRIPLLTSLAAICLFAAPAYADVSVNGAVERPEVLSLATLQTLPIVRVKGFSIVSSHGTGVPHAYRGVRLRDLLTRAGIQAPDKKANNRTYVMATGKDGYAVLFSWNELFNLHAGDGVLVVFEQDGKPLDGHEGPAALLVTGDQKTGPRHVRNLETLTVQVVPLNK